MIILKNYPNLTKIRSNNNESVKLPPSASNKSGVQNRNSEYTLLFCAYNSSTLQGR